MKRKIKAFVASFIVSIFCFSLLIGGAYWQLKSQRETVQNNVSSVPYQTLPSNKGVMLDVGGDKTFFFLNFQSGCLCLVYADDYEEQQLSDYGYTVDYYINGSFKLISGIVDRVGGIDTEYNGELLCCTGEQIVEILSYSADYQQKRREITEKIIDKISKNGFKLQDFLYIIENSETSVSLPDCYFWPDYIESLCSCVRIID